MLIFFLIGGSIILIQYLLSDMVLKLNLITIKRYIYNGS